MGQRRAAPSLSLEQQQGLEGLHRRGCSHRVRQRAHAVLLSAKGYSLDQAADVLGVDRDAVSRWLDRWERGGLDALADAPKSGRPPKVDAALVAEVVVAAQQSPASVRRTLAKRGCLGVPATTP